MANILLVDDHPMLRQGVAQLIDMEESLTVIGEAGDGIQAVAKAKELDPDMVLLDLNMKGMSGIETLAEMRKHGVKARIVVFTVSDNQEDVALALREGADGYLLKDSEPEEILAAIKKAATGEQVFSPQLTQIMAMALREQSNKNPKPVVELTPKEHETLRLIAQGMSNKGIARELGISEATVKVHVKHLLKKLALKSRVEAALWAVSNGILDSELD